MKRMIALCAAATLITGSAMAEYPERPITILVPFNAGGSTDIIGRIVAQHLTEELGSPVVVENRGGGGGTIGAAVVAGAEADGYTLLLATTGTHSINPNLREVGYDPIGDFAPISLAVETPVLVTVHPSLPVETLADLVALGQADPGALNYASAGIGATSHLASEMFNHLTGAQMVHIPYPGAGPALNDVVAGRVQVFMNNMPPFLPHVESGALRPLAVASERRSALMPDVPTAAEAGLDGFVLGGWFGLVAPDGTDPEILDLLYQAMAAINDNNEVSERLNNVGAEMAVSESREAFGEYISSMLETWTSVVQLSGAEVD